MAAMPTFDDTVEADVEALESGGSLGAAGTGAAGDTGWGDPTATAAAGTAAAGGTRPGGGGGGGSALLLMSPPRVTHSQAAAPGLRGVTLAGGGAAGGGGASGRPRLRLSGLKNLAAALGIEAPHSTHIKPADGGGAK